MKRTKVIFAIIMSIMMMVTFIPCMGFAADTTAETTADKADLSNAAIHGVQDQIMRKGFDPEAGICQPTEYDPNVSEWDRQLSDITVKVEDSTGHIIQLKQGTSDPASDGDFYVTYENNKALGTATINFIAIAGSEYCKGQTSRTFDIHKLDQRIYGVKISKTSAEVGNTITLSFPRGWETDGYNICNYDKKNFSLKASNSVLTVDPSWTFKSTPTEDRPDDGTYTFKIKCNAAGTSTLTLNFPGNTSYAAVAKKYSITVKEPKKPIKVTKLSKTSYTYTGKAKRPTPTVKSGTKVLKLNTDYTVTYKNNVNASKKAQVIVKAKGSKYGGTVTKYFTIVKAKQGINVTIDRTSLKKTGSTSTAYIKQKASTKTSNVGVFSYTTSNSNIIKVTRDKYHNCKVTAVNPGTATVTIKAAGTSNLKAATKKVSFTVTSGTQKNITKDMVMFTLPNGKRVTDISTYTFAKKVYPDVTMFKNKTDRDAAIKTGNVSKRLIFNTDWSFEYNTAGKQLLVWGQGNSYKGTLTYKYNTK